MNLTVQHCRPSPLLLLIAFCVGFVAVYNYYSSGILNELDLKRESAVTSQTLTVHHQQQQHAVRRQPDSVTQRHDDDVSFSRRRRRSARSRSDQHTLLSAWHVHCGGRV